MVPVVSEAQEIFPSRVVYARIGLLVLRALSLAELVVFIQVSLVLFERLWSRI